MRQSKTKNIWVAAILITVVTGYLTSVVGFREPSQPEVLVTFAGYTNSVGQGMFALLRLQNNGKDALRRHRFCTIAWTNGSGNPTNSFFSLTPTKFVLRPGNSETVAVRPPPDPGLWTTSFGFDVQASSFQRTVRAIHNTVFFFLPNKGSDALFVFFGPKVTLTNSSLGRP